MKRFISLLLAALLLCLPACSEQDRTVTLTDAYTVICPEDADTNITQAALILQTFLKEKCGIAVDTTSVKSKEAICLTLSDKLADGQYRMRLDGKSIVIEAKTSDALLLGMRKIRTALYNTFVLEQETPAAPVITTELCASLSGTINMAEAPFSVLTQNIKNSDMDDGGTIEERSLRFDKLIAEFQPDVINTQESNNEKWQTFYETMLSDVYDRYPAEGALSTRPNTILYRRDRFELQDAGTFYLSDTPDVPSSLPEAKHVRMCTWVLLKDRITGDTVMVCNTHIDNSADEVRVRQTKILVEQLKDEIAEYPLCVTGDFNGNYLSDIYLAAAEALNDPHLNKDINFSEYAYTWNTVNKSYQRRLDFCFHNDLLKPVYYRILTDGYGGVISDHYGVLTEFTS